LIICHSGSRLKIRAPCWEEALSTERVECRLAAILAADVAGYSRLMGLDEEGTLKRLKEIRADLIDPTIAEHRGRIVKTTGDGMLVEFHSVVDAMRCASAWQAAMADRNTSVPADDRIELRIGVNLGDIIIDGDDILAMASTLPRVWRLWQSRAVSAFRARC
jgi:adenylate cyclase